ncbi:MULTISPECIES: PaaI family thioesterase [unclassified Rhodococcus (in: high G+C Gram-positive bacteria)]|uniref:PaaI family thioesterase n=1 Tax=unclassified Rhodococcus (in: high G+C Gram-positive bacteria) TaxID=192944 RepID=UPI000926E550|nr:PaaI family thioesterase [Rhodococcus sp. M8]OLL21542.1 hypothetical protein BKE56_013265 [Rhodococcus sp. M8]QPG48332.1 PaaI family thioesterase [Rhodococcus sp. M8]
MDVSLRPNAPIDIWNPDWNDPFDPTVEAGDEFAELVAAVRAVQEAFTRSRPDPAAASGIAGTLRSVAQRLEELEVGEDDQIAGHRWDLAGRGQALAPPLHIDAVTETTARGRVTVGRFHAGRYAMNGGVTPLIFDEIMARLANDSGRPWARTAYLNVNFRAPAPLDVELRVEAEYLRQDGRKRFMRGTMYHGEVLVADADGLWVELKPEQTINISEGGDV